MKPSRSISLPSMGQVLNMRDITIASITAIWRRVSWCASRSFKFGLILIAFAIERTEIGFNPSDAVLGGRTASVDLDRCNKVDKLGVVETATKRNSGSLFSNGKMENGNAV